MPDQITQAWKQALRERAEAELKRRAQEIRRRTAASLVITDSLAIEDMFRRDQAAEDAAKLREAQ